MTAGTVLLWRHGRTAFNAQARLQGQVDIELDEVGRWQASEAAAELARRVRPDRIVASDLVRAAGTARALAQVTGLEVHLDPRLRERNFGAWEGLTGPEIAERWPEQYAAWRSGNDPERTGAESRAQVAERMASAVIAHSADLSEDQTLAVVSHGAAITLGITTLLGLDPHGWRGVVGLHNAHWAVLHASTGHSVPAWRLGGHNIGPSVHVSDWNAGRRSESLPSSTEDALRS
ncbi:histidine phosphatase family protein [Actinotalea sp. K2]|uniref:histidine phosphatase family protein n=1 Tax=Actinotalea sp. K2 TaxID=2939438 RepID=UPI002016D2D3|nr:histidine phosphatase family protein [Actinotalea sp. K2]MCL3860563.1 histidine phosphatase family protein [Actinotalea sp. K2]